MTKAYNSSSDQRLVAAPIDSRRTKQTYSKVVASGLDHRNWDISFPANESSST